MTALETGLDANSGKPKKSNPTNPSKSNGKAKGLSNGTRQGTNGRGKSGNTGTGTPSVVPPASSPGASKASGGTHLTSAQLTTLPSDASGAFPPVPPPPGQGGITSRTSTGTSASSHSSPAARTTGNDPTRNDSVPANVPDAVSGVQARAESLALLLLIGGFGIATSAIVIAAGYRGRRRTS